MGRLASNESFCSSDSGFEIPSLLSLFQFETFAASQLVVPYLISCIMYLKAVPLFAPAVLGLALPAPDAAPVPVPVPARLPAAIPALEAELLERQISSNGGK